MTKEERVIAREAIARVNERWEFTFDMLCGTTVVADLNALRNSLPAALNALDDAENQGIAEGWRADAAQQKLDETRAELARVRTHSAAQAETVAELNGEIAELQNQIHEWEESDAAGEAFTAIIDRQQAFIAEQTCSIFSLDERNLEHQHEEKRLRAEIDRLKAPGR
jgi:chromosome segregation ATPase